MGVTTISAALIALRSGLSTCECGEPAGADPVRCTDCGGPLCPACAAPPGRSPGPLALCFGCAVRSLIEAPADERELADVLLEIEETQRAVAALIGLAEIEAA